MCTIEIQIAFHFLVILLHRLKTAFKFMLLDAYRNMSVNKFAVTCSRRHLRF